MIIYKTTNLINGKIYIGKDYNNDPLYYGSGNILKYAIKKYGKENFRKEVLEECTKDNINSREIFWISYYRSRDRNIGHNIAKGGTGGDTISSHPNKVAIGKAHSLKLKGKDSQKTTKGPLTEQTKRKISEALSGAGNPMYGKVHSDETKQKISKAQKAIDRSSRVVTTETRTKISNANRGRKHSHETKQKISEKNSGVKNGFYGKTHSEENIEKFRKIGSRPKSTETKKKLSESMVGRYNGRQNKPFIANNVTYSSIGDCNRKTSEEIHIIRKKLKSGIYQYV